MCHSLGLTFMEHLLYVWSSLLGHFLRIISVTFTSAL